MTCKTAFSVFVALTGLLPAIGVSAERIDPLPYVVPARLPDAADVLPPSAVHLDGWLGHRVDINAKNRLLTVDTEPLLAGFHKKPGSHPWIGEHVGKWMHAATLAWAYTGDPELRKKLDRVAAELISTQEPDGYLGTYIPSQRFGLYENADWDVWSHKYNLLGLLTYYQYTGDKAALAACRKMGDLLIATFPAKRSIVAAGNHMGMAATSVLEPTVLLYRATGDERYLKFARYIIEAWDEPDGPKIIATLLTEKQVNKTANGKAYEMLSNLVGLCELARATGDRALLKPVLNAWQDIVDKRLYLTGSASADEHFQADFVLPNGVNSSICETCVTTTWIQLNLQLLRLTGEARFGDELEHTLYNHLAAAQHLNGADWCYYTALEGRKPYDSGINCCHSSGPRGMALAPQAAYLHGRDAAGEALLVDTLESSQGKLFLGGQTVTVLQKSGFPRSGQSTLTLHLEQPATFALRVRVPSWAKPLTLQTQDASVTSQGGWATLATRQWKDGDRIAIKFTLGPRLVNGEHGNAGRAAAAWGPFILAYDQQKNAGLPSVQNVALLDSQPLVTLRPDRQLMFDTKIVRRSGGNPIAATLTTFADAGATGGVYRVWLRSPGSPAVQDDSLLSDGEESRSRQGNVEGSINDGDLGSFAVTFDERPAKGDWFAVTLAAPVSIGRVVFAHGKTFHDGGWFDASAGKPQVQVKREKGGRWETVGALSDYPATTATDARSLAPGQQFTLRLPKPVSLIAVRVVGVPACGDNPRQAFASCAELRAMKDAAPAP
jgi:uncharacterized protein